MTDNYQFKIGLYLGELGLPFVESLDVACDLGASYVWCGTHSNNRTLAELPDDEIDAAAEQVAARGLEFFLLDGGGLFKTVHLAELESGKMMEHSQFKEQFDKLERSMEVSVRLGIPAVGCSSFAWPAEYTAGKPTWPMRWATRGGIISDGDMEKLIEAFSMLADLAEKYDVDIAFLMMMWNYGNTSRNFRRIMEAVNSRRLKALWCPADAYNCGEIDNATTGFENLRPYLHGVHCKDLRTINGSKLEFEYCPIAKGHVDYPTILRNLSENECDVILSIATHFLPESGSRLEAMQTNFANIRGLIGKK